MDHRNKSWRRLLKLRAAEKAKAAEGEVPEEKDEDDGIDDDKPEVEPLDELPILYELQIKPPPKIGRGKGRVVPWWNRRDQYQRRRRDRKRSGKKKRDADGPEKLVEQSEVLSES